ncbi:MAG: replication-associated recombination protein A [Alphaproteobacteria bacterium]|nr:MAG: replication-associated recombination protein A [Alphaproteobacteria bacterium]
MAKPQSKTLFSAKSAQTTPLADQLRPQRLEDIVGQNHILGPDGTLTKILSAGKLPSIIFWGPPGCGKTTIARLIAEKANLYFEQLSAVFSGVADLKKVFEAARARAQDGMGTLLFVDEIHRFNRSQQDSFLPYVEDGTITLLGATTENPSFELNAALLSRCQVLVLNALTPEDLETLLQRAEKYLNKKLPLDENARELLVQMADGDGRYILNMAEQLFGQNPKQPMDKAALTQFLQKRAPLYDKDREGHYNLISALHKSLRGSDVDAALYWLARMLTAGEDPHYVLRRMTRFASEDIGIADPNALTQCIAAWETFDRLGSPEGELAIVQATIYLATAPKSNAAYIAQGAAWRAARQTGSAMPPKHILNAPTKLMQEIGYGKGYEYDHDAEQGFSGQNYFPDTMHREQFYQPKGLGYEKTIKERIDYWADLRRKKAVSS